MAVINGTPGDDQFENALFGDINGFPEDDQYFGFSGNDFLIPSRGNDLLDGGDDFDVAIYDAAGLSGGVIINNRAALLGSVAAFSVDKGVDGTDTLVAIENFHGTDFDDTIYVGGLGDTYSFDRAGDDLVVASEDPNAEGHTFNAGSGNDEYIGTADDGDRVDYTNDNSDTAGPISQGIVVDLDAGTATDGWGDTDTLSGIERIEATLFADFVDLGSGDRNEVRGLAGNDTLIGGDGARDRVDYSRDADYGGTSGVTVDFSAGTATDGFGDTDSLSGFERARGTDFGDTLLGDDQDNDLSGEAGDDVIEGRGGRDFIEGGPGNDTLDGGGDRDTLDYRNNDAGTGAITVDTNAGTVIDPYGDTDTISNFERIRGTELGDTMSGDAGQNNFAGFGGDDTLLGLGGNDELEGGRGNDILDGGADDGGFSNGDRARYRDDEDEGATQGIVANLTTGIATDGFGDTDTLIDIESIEATDFDDTLIGDDGRNSLRGYGGNDTITAGLGNDNLNGGDGDDTLDGGVGGDFFSPGAGNDTVIGGENGPLMEDDELSYIFDSRDSGTTAGIIVAFTGELDGTVIDYAGDTDTFSGIERVRGTNNADSFVGAEGRQHFLGFGGDDFFDGGDGDRDRIDYSRAQSDLGASQGIVVDMVAGSATDAFGDTDTFVNIEEIRGTDFADVITGDTEKNDIQGGGGDDTLDSFGGSNNFISAGRGNDTIFARGDRDFVNGDEGNDSITFFGEGGGVNPGLGSDSIVAGTNGFFSIQYNGIGESVTIDTALGTTQLSGGDVDTFVNIRNIEGGDGDDTLLGDDGADRQEFISSLGNDFIDGRGGGRDWLIYDRDEETQVTVDFAIGQATGAFAGTDTFVNIEAVRGTSGNDTFIGGTQEFTEYQGLDGVDTYAGGSGLDRISFSFDDNRGATNGITIDLAAETAVDGFGNAETFTSIEQVTGSFFGDTILGDGEENILIGLEGDDAIDGRGGDDGIFAGAGTDTITSGGGADRIGGRLFELDGDTITDLSAEDAVQVFDDNFNTIGADLLVLGSELRIDTDGDGTPEATMLIGNGYSGPVNSVGGPASGPLAATFSIEGAGLYSRTIEEGDITLSIEISRSGDTFAAGSVDVTVSGAGLNPADAADIASDFGVAQTIDFGPNETTKTVEIVINEDGDIEPSEDLSIALSNPVSDGVLPAEIEGAETFVRILNDDQPDTVNITGGRAPEDSGILTFTVSRTGDTTNAIDVPWSLRSADGLQGAESDDLVAGLPQSGVVTIPVGSASTTFDILIVPDSFDELHDDVIASISEDPSWPAGLSVGVKQANGSIRNDDGVPPAPPVGSNASNWGDPHLVTLDGLNYEFQAVGEFTLIRSTSGDPLNIQARYAAVPGSDIASETAALATELGTARVVIDTDASDLIRVNGSAFDLSTATGGVAVGNGHVFFDGEKITLVFDNGEQLHVDLFDGFLNASVFVASGRDVQGLLGNADGNRSNDLALPDGTVLPQPVSFEDLYGTYADAWRIDDATSLFDYPTGLGTADFTDKSFPIGVLSIDDIPPELLEAAEAAAEMITDPIAREAAIFDALVTGDPLTAARSAETTREAVEETEPTGAPSIASAIGVTASAAQIVEGNTGLQSLVFTLFRVGDALAEETVAYRFVGDADAGDGVGIADGIATFEEGEAAQVVEVGVSGDFEFEDDEEIRIEIEVTSGSSTVINSQAATLILNDDSGNLPPVASAIDAGSVFEDGGVVTIDLLVDAGASDSDGGTLGVANVVVTDESGASVVFGISGSELTIDPVQFSEALGENESATLTVSYEITDGQGGVTPNTATLEIDGRDGLLTQLSDSGERFITEDEGPNRVFGDDGDDVIATNAGNDIIAAGAGADVVLAGGGDDTILGGLGPDTLTGGAGSDVFAFSPDDFATVGFTADFITDFVPGEDVIELAEFGVTDLSSLSFVTVAEGDAIDLGSGRFIVLEGLSAADLQEGDVVGTAVARSDGALPTTQVHRLTEADDRFITTDAGPSEIFGKAGGDAIVGGAGDDTIRGEGGADVLIGGAGNDRLIGGEGADTLTGRDGEDVFEFVFGEETGFVAEFITDFEPGVDAVDLAGFGILSEDDFVWSTAGSGDIALQLTPTRFLVFEGFDTEQDIETGAGNWELA